MDKAKVGIFFLVNDSLLIDAIQLSDGENYGDAINFSGHFEYWEALIPQNPTEQLFKNHAYDYFPRGRAVYFKNTGTSRLYVDGCLKKTDIEKVASILNLANYQLSRDEHYQCAQCNSDFMD